MRDQWIWLGVSLPWKTPQQARFGETNAKRQTEFINRPRLQNWNRLEQGKVAQYLSHFQGAPWPQTRTRTVKGVLVHLVWRIPG